MAQGRRQQTSTQPASAAESIQTLMSMAAEMEVKNYSLTRNGDCLRTTIQPDAWRAVGIELDDEDLGTANQVFLPGTGLVIVDLNSSRRGPYE